MLIFRAQDQVSSVTGQIDDNVQSMASSAQAALASMTSGMANLSTVSDSLIGSLNSGKSASDIIFGNASKAETNKVLINNMTKTKEAAADLYDTVDRVTDSSLVSMQQLIPSLNAFKAATGASDDEIKDITDDMANFGAAVLAQTGSTALAETAMMSLSKGVKGAFAALDQYGVSEDALKRTGKWSGDEEDVRGFMEAVTEVMGSTKELMETNQGLDALIEKAFSRGGKKIGNEFLPVIKDVKRGFLDLDNALGGNLTASILLVGEGIDVMNSALFNVSTAVRGFEDLSTGVKQLKSWIKGAGDVAEAANDATDAVHGMSNAMSTVGNAGEMGANVTGMGAAGAEAAKGAGKGEKAVEAGTDALFAADMLKDTKSKNKDYAKLKKELESSKKLQNEIGSSLDALSVFDSLPFNSGKASKPISKQLSDIGFFDDALFAGMEKFGAKGNKKAIQQYSDVLLENMTSPIQTIEDLVKSNDGARKEAGKLLEELSPANTMLDEDTLKLWEKSERTATEAIGNHLTGFKEKITGAFSSIKNFDFKGKLTAPFTKIASSIKNFSFGETLQNALQKGFGGLGDITRGISGKLSSFGNSIKNIKMPDIRGKLNGLNKSLYQSISGFSFGDAFKGLKDKISGLRGATEVVSEIDDVVDGVEGVAEAASAAGAAAPAMEAGAAGTEAAAAATTSLSAAFTSMIVPALALAAVVAIMIPIVAGIAAEAMIFIKILGEFMQALNFDSIDLKGSVEGIKQIATGLAYVGAAMLAMTGVSILVGINSMITLFTGIKGPLKVASDALKEAAEELQGFQSVNIDSSVGEKIKTISDSLSSISGAMMSLTSVTITTGFSNFIAWAFQFGDVTSALDQAKDDIMQASSKLQEFSSLQPLPDSVAQNIQNVCNSLSSVGDAIGALRSIRDGQNWDGILGGLFGGVDIQGALNKVKTDIYNAATALSSWTGLPDIPQGIGDKIKSISDGLGSLKSGLDSMKSVAQTYDGGFIGWIQGGLFGGADIQGSIDKAISEINQVATKLASIQITNIPDLSFIQRVSVGLSYLKQAGTQLSQFSGVTISPDISEKVRLAVESVGKVASYLSGMASTNVGDVNGLLTIINTALTNIRTTLANAAAGFAAPAQGIGAGIVSGVQSGLSPLGGVVQSSVSSGISSASGVATSGGQTLGTNVTTGFKSNLKLGEAMSEEMGHVLDAVNSGLAAAKSAAASGASEIVEAFKSGYNAGSPGDIYRAMKAEMGYTRQAITEAYGPLTTSAFTAAKNIVSAFGTPSLDLPMGPLNPANISSMQLAGSKVDTTSSNGNTTTIIFQEGSMPIDARNMTTKEAKQMLILALESLNLYDPNPKAQGE